MKTEDEILKEAIKLFKPSKRNIGECIEKAISLTKQSERKRILENEIKFLQEIIDTTTNENYWKHPHGLIVARIKELKKEVGK